MGIQNWHLCGVWRIPPPPFPLQKKKQQQQSINGNGKPTAEGRGMMSPILGPGRNYDADNS